MAVAVAPRAAIASPSGWARTASIARLVLTLGKARVVGLVTFTALVSAVVAADGRPEPGTLLALLAVGLLAGGGAGALNHALDRDIDRRMARTSGRPLVVGSVSPRLVSAIGAAAVALGLAVAWQIGPLVALQTLVAALTYLVVYTRLLKRQTAQSVVVGGWTGAAAVLAGWQATGAALDLTALALALVVFLWTPGHFWSLAIVRLEEYRRAGVPALPVVLGSSVAAWASGGSAVLTIAVSALVLADHRLGWLYGVLAAVAAVGWLFASGQLARCVTRAAALRAFALSNVYLAVLFAGALLDALLRIH